MLMENRSKNDKNQFIYAKTVDNVKKQIESLFEQKRQVQITVHKSKMKTQQYTSYIKGVYPSFFTVEDEKLKITFSIQYIDILTGTIKVCG